MRRKWILAATAWVAVTGCSAISTRGGGANVQLASAQPPASCRYIGEAFGSQGNWFTGDFTANAKLMKGARNDLRNKAAAMGGDYVWVQHQANAHAYGSLGTDNTTVIGNVYVCGHGGIVTASPAAATAHAWGDTASARPAPAPASVTSAGVVLAAQRVAASQGCGDVRTAGPDSFAAPCGATQDLLIRCDGDDCQPVRMVRRDGNR